MKKNLIILCLMTVSSLAYSQVGINTPNPQGTFHVDGAKDNAETGTPTAAQQANDFTVTSTGNVGVGTTAPTNKLEVNNGTTAGAIKIVDGTQGLNKALMSDANGVGTWGNIPGGSWFGLLNGGSTNAVDTRINFTTSTVIGSGGSADAGTDAIIVPSTGLYEVTISGWTAASTSPYLTVWQIRRNGTSLATPHYAAPNAAWGTQVSTTQYTQLNAGDILTLFLISNFTGGNTANQALVVSFTVKLIQ